MNRAPLALYDEGGLCSSRAPSPEPRAPSPEPRAQGRHPWLRRGRCRSPAALGRSRDHRCGRVDHHNHDEPAHVEQGQRLHDEGRHQHRQRATQGQADGRSQVVCALGDELHAAHRHQERTGAHHDRVRRRGVHAEQADEDHARRIEADAERHQRSKHEVDRQGDREFPTCQSERCASARHEAEQLQQHDAGRDEERRAHRELNRASRHAGDDAGAQPRAGRRRSEHQREGRELHLHELRVDNRLHHRGHDVADVEGAGNLLVGHELPPPEHRGRRRIRADAESVEEVRNRANTQVQRGGPHGLVRAVAAGGKPGAGSRDPFHEIGQGENQHCGDEQCL